MLVKNEYDRQGLQAIGGIVAMTLEALCRAAVPGVTTASLDQLAADMLWAYGAEATPKKEFGFPGRVCISVNDEVVHGIPGTRELREGDLVKMDLTADRHGYVADASRMALLPPADERAKLLAECARRACRAAVDQARPAMRLHDLGAVVQRIAHEDGFRVIKGLTGHGVGRRTHEEPEVPNFADSSNHSVLREGMVIAIEPIIAWGGGEIRDPVDGWTVVTADGGWAAHYEETVIIGAAAAEVVTVCPF